MEDSSKQSQPESSWRTIIQVAIPWRPFQWLSNVILALTVGEFFWQHSNGDWLTAVFTSAVTFALKATR